MQFQFNADYPGIDRITGQPIVVTSGSRPGAVTATSTTTNSSNTAEVMTPPAFPPVQPVPCAKITTRVFHPSRNQVATVQNVLVCTVVRSSQQQQPKDDDSMSSSSSSSSLSTFGSGMSQDTSMDNGSNNNTTNNTNATGNLLDDEEAEDRAYWIQRTIREAIYGRVLLAVVMKRRAPTQHLNDHAEWEVTNQHVAVKEMNWQHIRRERDRLAEDPIKEVSAMQYIKRWHALKTKEKKGLSTTSTNKTATTTTTTDTTTVNVTADNTTVSTSPDQVLSSFRAILETNIMMPLDLLSDDRHLYSVMPYCDGGELFERLDMNERFPEEEARYWMHQLLNGLENLQNCGICHRDMSLENLLVHESGALIIDLGMCLRVPYIDTFSLAESFDTMSVNGGAAAGGAGLNAPSLQSLTMELNARTKPRCLISPQGTCGKWIYMSPEVYKNREPFDGYAVDIWAAGVILFLMLTGFPPWERACQTDERFKYMTAGYLVQMLTEWDIGVSGDGMDLLQRMLFLDPKDRLSLDQVRMHPWMVNGPRQPPTDFSNF